MIITGKTLGPETDFEYTRVEVLRVIDGDTVELKIDFGFCIWHTIRCRLYGINAFELPTPEGLEAAQFLSLSLTLGKITAKSFKNDKKDKYGRYLIELFKNGKSVNQQMVSSGYAIPYKA